ncbi:MAG: hypothetical protein JXA98_02200 [Methanosarcinaceae archaeon]|nr:hypothetical protein [Methanosarcinaceae archaeon]
MLIRKNISLDEKYLKKLQPLLDKNNGNLSAAIRDAIVLTDVALKNHGTIEKSIEMLNAPAHSSRIQGDLIESGDKVIINQLTLQWLLEISKGIIIDTEIVNEFINPFDIQTMAELDDYLNKLSKEFDWNIEVSIFCEDMLTPETVTIMFSKGNPHIQDFFAKNVALFLAKWKHLDIDKIYRRSKSMRIDFKRISMGPEEVPSGIREHFGYLDEICKEVQKRPEFWSELVHLHRIAINGLITIPQCQFEDFVLGNAPDDVMMFEMISKQYIREIPLHEYLLLFKKVILTMQIVNNIEIQLEPGHESIKIQHEYKNENMVSKLIHYFSNILEANGHTYDVTNSGSLIFFKHSSKN